MLKWKPMTWKVRAQANQSKEFGFPLLWITVRPLSLTVKLPILDFFLFLVCKRKELDFPDLRVLSIYKTPRCEDAVRVECEMSFRANEQHWEPLRQRARCVLRVGWLAAVNQWKGPREEVSWRRDDCWGKGRKDFEDMRPAQSWGVGMVGKSGV